MNYSKSFLLWQNESEDKSPAAIEAGTGDMIATDDLIIVNENETLGNKLMLNSSDTILYVNRKIFAITIPQNEDMIPWFKNLDCLDLSSLQFLNCSPLDSESYYPFLKNQASKRPDVGISFAGDFKDMEKLLKIFKPEFIVQPTLHQDDFELLSRQDGVRMLMITLDDSVINEPLPALPYLSQIIIMESDESARITNDFFVNNPQISRVIMNNLGIFTYWL
jgi:hypothetical protein